MKHEVEVRCPGLLVHAVKGVAVVSCVVHLEPHVMAKLGSGVSMLRGRGFGKGLTPCGKKATVTPDLKSSSSDPFWMIPSFIRPRAAIRRVCRWMLM